MTDPLCTVTLYNKGFVLLNFQTPSRNIKVGELE